MQSAEEEVHKVLALHQAHKRVLRAETPHAGVDRHIGAERCAHRNSLGELALAGREGAVDDGRHDRVGKPAQGCALGGLGAPATAAHARAEELRGAPNLGRVNAYTGQRCVGSDQGCRRWRLASRTSTQSALHDQRGEEWDAVLPCGAARGRERARLCHRPHQVMPQAEPRGVALVEPTHAREVRAQLDLHARTTGRLSARLRCA
jgi:hypothetical protein